MTGNGLIEVRDEPNGGIGIRCYDGEWGPWVTFEVLR